MNWSKYWTENTGSRNSLHIKHEDDPEEGDDAGEPEVELEHAGDGVDVGGVGHVRRGIVPSLKCLAEVVDLHLMSWTIISNKHVKQWVIFSMRR